MRSTCHSILLMKDIGGGKVDVTVIPSSTREGRAVAHLQRLRAQYCTDRRIKLRLGDKITTHGSTHDQ